MSKVVKFSVTVVPKSDAQGGFRDTVLSLRTGDLEDCILSLFHISDSYALLSGEALPAANTTTNAALRGYLLRRLTQDDNGLDFDVRIEGTSPTNP